MHVFGRCLNHNDSSPTLEPIMIVWTLYVVNELKPKSLRVKEAQFVSWMSLSPTLKPIKGVFAWSTSKAKSSQDACLPSTSPSHFIIIKVQAHQVSSILNGSRRSKWPNFASVRIWFATSWLSIKFVCLFHVFMFLWIQNLHVVFNELCLCVYIYIYIYIYIK